ncbi:hypothetical protein P7K49_002147 [Saguinus oedipus]|uniref:Uncharacterized protein n=1 Tax=Saguinus oedipus TaxID=9490 RepID=A0ABQ9WGJ6_SAGOE|nr:hypothetical protein P7K49_002147 [Saguinus oedipus]
MNTLDSSQLQSSVAPGHSCPLVASLSAAAGAPAKAAVGAGAVLRSRIRFSQRVGVPLPLWAHLCLPARLLSSCAPVCVRPALPCPCVLPRLGPGRSFAPSRGRVRGRESYSKAAGRERLPGSPPAAQTQPDFCERHRQRSPQVPRHPGAGRGPGRPAEGTRTEWGRGRSPEPPARPRRWSAQAQSLRAPHRRLHPGSALQRQRRRPFLSSSSSSFSASASASASSSSSVLRPPSPLLPTRSPRRAPGLAVPCCPGGGAEGWRRRCLRPPRGTCGCCGCCSPASSSARSCAGPLPATRVSERAGRRPRGGPGPGSPGGERAARRRRPRPA